MAMTLSTAIAGRPITTAATRTRAALLIAMAAAVGFCIGAAPVAAAFPQQREKQPEAYQERIVEWVLEDPDGFFHPNILWKRLGPDGKSGPYAMHATADIPEGTPLAVVPRRYFLESGVKKDNATNPDTEHHMLDPRYCITVAKIWDEYFDASKKTSFYEPFLSYMFEEYPGGITRGLLPTSWSDHSKDLLYLILGVRDQNDYDLIPGDEFEFTDVLDICTVEDMTNLKKKHPDIDLDEKWFEEHEDAEVVWTDEDGNVVDFYEGEDEDKAGEKDKDGDEYEKDNGGIGQEPKGESKENGQNGDDFKGIFEEQFRDTYLFLLSIGWYDKILPIMSMFNHRNGPYRNIEITTIDDEDGNDVAAYAWRDIAKGEQLQYSYSECMDHTCHFGRDRYLYATPWIFSEFGFTEQYPQRWKFELDGDGDDEGEVDMRFLFAEVLEDEEGDGLVFRWVFETPDQQWVDYLQDQLLRLQTIEHRVRAGVEDLERVLLGEDRSRTTKHKIEHERESILEFYEAYVTVLELAVEHKDDPVGVTKEAFEKDLKALRSSGKKKSIEDLRKHELLASRIHPSETQSELLATGTIMPNETQTETTCDPAKNNMCTNAI